MDWKVTVTGEGFLAGLLIVVVGVVFIAIIALLIVDAQSFRAACLEAGGYVASGKVCIK